MFHLITWSINLIISLIGGIIKYPKIAIRVGAFIVGASLMSGIRNAPDMETKVRLGVILAIALALAWFVPRYIKRWKQRDAEKEEQEIRKITDPDAPDHLESLEAQGYIFGEKEGKIIRKPENKEGHILVVGGSGTGKTSCLVIPSLLAWQGRAFAVDVKGELYQKTKAKRGKANRQLSPKTSVNRRELRPLRA